MSLQPVTLTYVVTCVFNKLVTNGSYECMIDWSMVILGYDIIR